MSPAVDLHRSGSDLDSNCLTPVCFPVKCPAGTYFNIVSERCESCEIGTYQPREGELTCVVCPRNTSTASDNTKSVNECKGVCVCVYACVLQL